MLSCGWSAGGGQMKRRRGQRRSERGQATLEFVIVFPLLFGLFLLALAVAAVWGGHHLSSAVSLEGAARESARAGAGAAFVQGIGNAASRNTTFTTEIADFDSPALPRGRRFTVIGEVRVPWAPLGLDWNVRVQATTFYPVWEFHGE